MQLINAPGVQLAVSSPEAGCFPTTPEPRAGITSKRLSGISQQAEFVG